MTIFSVNIKNIIFTFNNYELKKREMYFAKSKSLKK